MKARSGSSATTPSKKSRLTFANVKPLAGRKLKVESAKVTKSQTVAARSPIKKTIDFYIDDFNRTLFPLRTNKELVLHGENELKSYIARCLDPDDKKASFLPQKRAYAAKPGMHLRRTVKLDPVSEYYIYDLIYRNRNLFRKPHEKERSHYGYRFEGGYPTLATAAYKAFKSALAEYRQQFSCVMSFDVSSYFNSLYHHDIVSWFAEIGASNEDIEGLGQLLRQANSGRSVDCLPQGLYPTKMIGNDLLRFVDNHHRLKSDRLVRFMDDIYLFANNEAVISDDFQLIQRLLGDKNLSINPQKTLRGLTGHIERDNSIDEVKSNLLERRRQMVVAGYDDETDEVIIRYELAKKPLSSKELSYISDLLNQPNLEEEDAELILFLMRENVKGVEKRLPYIIEKFPNLTKSLHAFCAGSVKPEAIADIVLSEASKPDQMMEFQLFWFGAMLEDFLIQTPKASALIDVLYNHRSATSLSRAKILEVPDRRFGLPELRNEQLHSGQSDWLAWSSAVGSRSLKATSRNHVLNYFGNSSEINYLISSIVTKMP